MNRSKILGILLLCFVAKGLISQGENNNWYFGNGAGISFNTTPSSMLSNGANMASFEGVASISCPNGNLLFYTDGYTIFNKNHVMMGNGNGINGCESSAQNVIIVPQPQTPNIFYVFTVPAGCVINNGFQYSIVDLSLNSGLGGVTSKNVLINGITTQGEKITSTLHGNGIDVWISIENYATNNIEMYLLTSSGLNTTPVVSSIIIPGVAGPGIFLNPVSSLSTLKFSKDGTKFINFIQKSVRRGPTTDYYNYLEIFDFNKTTGVLTLFDTVLLPYQTSATYPNSYKGSGVEFSADGSKVYFTYNNIGYAPDLGKLYQVDITTTNITASLITIATGPGDFLYMQRGPDDKIYVNQHSTWDIVGIINNPNISGGGYTYSHFNYSATGKTVRTGFPQLIAGFITSPYLSDYTYVDTCFNQNTSFTLITNVPSDVDSVKWDFDDLTTGVNNTSVLQNPFHTFSSPGIYNVELLIYYPCFTDTVVKNILIDSVNVSITGNTPFCAGDSIMLDAGAGFLSYLWSNGDTTQATTIYTAGTYSVIAQGVSGCAGYDTNIVVTQIAGVVVAQSDQGSTSSGVATSINVYTNDQGDVNSIAILNGPYNGSASITGGVLNYQSSNSFLGIDSIEYMICDLVCGTACDTTWVVISVESEFLIPEFVSPNGDGLNDTWYIKGLNRYPNNSVKIFNRWGNMLFDAAPYQNDWDGTTEKSLTGDKVVSGVYFYVLELNGGESVYTGYIQLFR